MGPEAHQDPPRTRPPPSPIVAPLAAPAPLEGGASLGAAGDDAAAGAVRAEGAAGRREGRGAATGAAAGVGTGVATTAADAGGSAGAGSVSFGARRGADSTRPAVASWPAREGPQSGFRAPWEHFEEGWYWREWSLEAELSRWEAADEGELHSHGRLGKLRAWMGFNRERPFKVRTMAALELCSTLVSAVALWIVGCNGFPLMIGQWPKGEFDMAAAGIAAGAILMKLSVCGTLLLPPEGLRLAQAKKMVDLIVVMTVITFSTNVSWAVIEVLMCFRKPDEKLDRPQLTALVALALLNFVGVVCWVAVEFKEHSSDWKLDNEERIPQLPMQAFSALSQEEAEFCSTCAICLEEYRATDEVCKLPCCHIFHTECGREWFRRGSRCPFRCKDWLTGDSSV
mmetsp:Transcript_75634/g.245921  ORF Transcript_75634/g.245921 Transcript_75634/m.245921 type:complete len:398 (-) Transcript_75634:221-1414(-)